MQKRQIFCADAFAQMCRCAKLSQQQMAVTQGEGVLI